MKKTALFSTLLSFAFLFNLQYVNASTSTDAENQHMINHYLQHQENFDAAYIYAVDLARRQDYNGALTLLDALAVTYPAQDNVLFDRIVITGWAGNHRAAVELYEQNIQQETNGVPAYVKAGVAGSYVRIGEYQKARALYHQLAMAGDRQAALWEGETLLRIGLAKEAGELYQKLIDADPANPELYLGRASSYILSNNFVNAQADIDHAIQLIPDDRAGKTRKRQIYAAKAAEFLRAGNYTTGVYLLKPFIIDGTADVHMQGDYILGLYLMGEYKTAIMEAKQLWPDLSSVPVFGLQAVADAYLRLGQGKEAVLLYQRILDREPTLMSVKVSMAYALMLDGAVDQAVKTYQAVMAADPHLADTAVQDAAALINRGRFNAGKRLFQVITELFPANRLYRQTFANVLYLNQMFREAYDQYNLLSTMDEGELNGADGAVKSAVAAGDYEKAKRHLTVLMNKYPDSLVTGDAKKVYDQRRHGGLDVTFSASSNHKDDGVRNWLLSSDQELGNNLFVLAAIGEKRITNAVQHTNLRLNAAGFQLRGIDYDATVWGDVFDHNGSFSGYNLHTNYYLSDQTKLRFNLSRLPIEDVDALNFAAGGPIMSQSNTLGFSRQIGTQNYIDVDFTRAYLSDGNQFTGYGARYAKNIASTLKTGTDLFVFGSKGSYRQQLIDGITTVYESPTDRVTYGTGVIKKWVAPTGYWEGTAVLEWGADRPEPIDFTPHFQLEYGYNVDAYSTLVLGMAYGLRTDRLNGNGDLQFNYREYTLNYTHWW